MPLGAYITPKMFIKLFWHYLHPLLAYWLKFLLELATGGINYAKIFMKLIPVANFIKLFQSLFIPLLAFALSIDSGYAAKGINYYPKIFMKLTPKANFIKLFSA